MAMVALVSVVTEAVRKAERLQQAGTMHSRIRTGSDMHGVCALQTIPAGCCLRLAELRCRSRPGCSGAQTASSPLFPQHRHPGVLQLRLRCSVVLRLPQATMLGRPRQLERAPKRPPNTLSPGTPGGGTGRQTGAYLGEGNVMGSCGGGSSGHAAGGLGGSGGGLGECFRLSSGDGSGGGRRGDGSCRVSSGDGIGSGGDSLGDGTNSSEADSGDGAFGGLAGPASWGLASDNDARGTHVP